MLFALPLLAALATAAPAVKKRGSGGCGKPLPSDTPSPLGSASYNYHIQSSGGQRSYLLFVPATYDVNKPVPLIFSFHGHGKDAQEQELLSQFSDSDYNKNAIAIYPQGLSDEWQGDPAAPSSVSDIQFTSDLIDHITDRYCIDENRIYAAGKSNGGGFTGELACSAQLSSKFAAFAACSGAFYNNTPTDVPCNPGRSMIPFLEFHGTADTTIPYSGGPRRNYDLPSIPSYLSQWTTRNGCAPGQKNTTTCEADNNVQISSWSCNGHQDVVQGYLINGLGHAWPSTQPNDDNPNGTYINATPIIMDFFSKYSL